MVSVFYGPPHAPAGVRTTSSTEMARPAHNATALSPFEKAKVTLNTSWNAPKPHGSLTKRPSTVGANLQPKKTVLLGQPGTPGAFRELPEVKKPVGRVSPNLKPIQG